jgi:tyrosine-protein phosphatase YwqE
MSWFSFFRKKEKPIVYPIDVSGLGVDMHAHWLPGIDDGAQNIEDSLKLVQYLHSLGFKKLIATPHVMSDFYRNSTTKILEKLQEVKTALEASEIDIELEAAAEYYFDEEFLLRIQNDDLLSIGKDRYVLFEFSYLNAPNEVYHAVTDLVQKGYKPLLAHPERYNYYAHDLEEYEKLSNMGVFFQLNIMSLTGHYGESAKHVAEWLIENNMVAFIGTDIHNERHFKSINHALSTQTFHNLEKDKLKNLSLLD